MSLNYPLAILLSAVLIVGAILINGPAQTQTSPNEMGYGIAAGTHSSDQGVAFVVNRDGRVAACQIVGLTPPQLSCGTAVRISWR